MRRIFGATPHGCGLAALRSLWLNSFIYIRFCGFVPGTPPWKRPVGVAGLEPAVSCSRSRRISHLSHTPRKCPAGVEPARSPWQGERLPLHHGHCDRRRFVKETQSTGWGSNPRHRLTRAVSCLLDHQCMPRVGPEGLEPSPAWLRARCAAANTLAPTIAKPTVGPGGVEPPSSGYQPSALPLSYRP